MMRAVLITSGTNHNKQHHLLTVKVVLAGNADVQNLFDVEVSSDVGGGELQNKIWLKALKLLWDVARLKNQADLIVLVPEVAVVVPLEA
jgi:hypothetical protein